MTNYGKYVGICMYWTVWPEESPNVYKSSPKMISQEKWKILTHLQNLPKNVGDFGKLIVAKGFKKLPKVQKIAKSGHTGTEAVESKLVKLGDQLSVFKLPTYLRTFWAILKIFWKNGLLFIPTSGHTASCTNTNNA